MIYAVLLSLLVLVLAWSNGANDVGKGVATLAGSGVAGARRAILWGSFCTVLGGLAAAVWGAALVQTFASGFISTGFVINLGFVAGAIAGAALWIGFATRFGLPVSTTHALLGGIVGSVLVTAGPVGLKTAAIANKALAPLLLSPVIAILLCWCLLLAARWVERRIPAWSSGCCARADWQQNPFVCAPEGQRPAPYAQHVWLGLHWLSSGVTSFARGLNDVPKIAAFLILILTLTPALSAIFVGSPLWPITLVALAMGLGSVWGGMRVLQVLAHRVTPLDPASGLAANVGTSLLVLLATPFGLPVSTTHVSTGALLGVRWGDKLKPQRNDALKLILFGWIVTLPIAAALAAVTVQLLELVSA